MARRYKQTSVVAVEILDVDLEDVDLNAFNWRLSSNGYAMRGPNLSKTQPKAVYVHRIVMERKLGRPLSDGEFVDHIDGTKTNNRRSNLRVATKSQNGMNRGSDANTSSRYVGVGRVKGHNLWQCYISVDGKRFPITKRSSEDEAAWMYDQWAIALHGEFARLNFTYVTSASRLQGAEA